MELLVDASDDGSAGIGRPGAIPHGQPKARRLAKGETDQRPALHPGITQLRDQCFIVQHPPSLAELSMLAQIMSDPDMI
jgi:hypothetical protein